MGGPRAERRKERSSELAQQHSAANEERQSESRKSRTQGGIVSFQSREREWVWDALG